MKVQTDYSENDQSWTMVIRSKRPWWDLNVKELWQYRDLIGLWVKREFVSLYKQTILGPLWHVIPPVVTSGVFSIIFSGIAQISTDEVPSYLFYMAGTTIWVYFSNCIASTSSTFIANVSVFGKVYFPRLAMPIAAVISQLVTFGVRFGVFLVFLLLFLLGGAAFRPNAWALLLPVLLLILAGLGFSFGIIVSALTTKYRDLQQLLTIGLQLLMYASPVIFPLSQVPENWRWLVLLNPLTPILEVFRLGFLGKSAISPSYLLYSAGFAIVILLISLITFNQAESTFLDTI
jgi:lipopolysaccharide transport system permease protein